MGRHPVDVLKAALQEAKTEAATLRIKTATLAQERNVVIEERNKARARVTELEQQNAVQRENVDEAMRENTRPEKERKGLRDELDILREEHEEAMARGAALVAENTRLTERMETLEENLHDAALFLESADWHLGVTRERTPWDHGLAAMAAKLRALDAPLVDGTTSDNAPFRQPEPCPPSSVTGKPCLLPPGHPPDSPTRFHRYAAPDPEARIRELEAEVQRLQQDRAQVGAFGFKPLGIR